MPALPPVPQVVKLKVEGTYHDAHWLNIYYDHYTGGPPSAGDLASFLLHLAGNMVTAYAAEMSADNEITLLTAEDLTSSTGASASRVVSVFGVRAGDFMPASVAMVASMEIGRRYRGGHPRKYLPWGTAGTMASGSTIDWDSSFLADCQIKFGTVNSEQLAGGPWGSTTFDENVNVSYVTAGARRVTPQVDIITEGVCRSRICSQRRRLGKVGG